jgi:phenylacetate-CoA ligase
VSSADGRLARFAWTGRMVAGALVQRRLPYASASWLRREQERRVRATVAYARGFVPYYRETMRRMILGPDDFRDAGDLARLPLIEREQLQRDPEYFVSSQWPPDACIMFRSSGSVGTPVMMLRDPPSLFASAAHYERLRALIARLAGRRLRYREAAILAPGGSTLTAISAVRGRSQLPQSLRVQLRSFSMFRSPAELLPELREFEPDVISSFGSYLEALFAHIRAARPDFRAPPVIVYGGDPLSLAMREWMRDELGVEVLSAYGAIEAPHVGFECEHHRGYHLNVDLYPVRVIGSDGAALNEGEAGEVVVSNLVNRGTVLLNYHLGDRLSLSGEPCPCGRSLPLGSYLERTKAAWIDLGGGRLLHAQALRSVLRLEPDVWRFQLIQEERRRLLLRLVLDPAGDHQASVARLDRRLREQLPNDAVVRIELVPDLPGGPSGKIQPIIALPHLA